MATFSAIPENLDIVFVKGDELEVPLSFDGQNLTGYTFESRIVKVVSVSGGNVTSTLDISGFTVTPVNLSAGQLKISLSEQDSASLEFGDSYRWYLRWVATGGKTRTAMSGAIRAVSP